MTRYKDYKRFSQESSTKTLRDYVGNNYYFTDRQMIRITANEIYMVTNKFTDKHDQRMYVLINTFTKEKFVASETEILELLADNYENRRDGIIGGPPEEDGFAPEDGFEPEPEKPPSPKKPARKRPARKKPTTESYQSLNEFVLSASVLIWLARFFYQKFKNGASVEEAAEEAKKHLAQNDKRRQLANNR